jgi:pimeloyl-ACP methyl ester carboxylesterase
MEIVTSKDGTQIAYDRQGTGPALILVDGALCYRSFGPMPGLAQLLAPHFTVYYYDRRGRGDSRDTKSYAVVREVEDIEALIDAAGESAYICGLSSGAALALESAIKLNGKIKKLAMYEAPYAADSEAQPAWNDYDSKLAKLLAEGRRGDAVVLFMTVVGTPSEMIDGMRQAPVWPMFEAVAPTLAYDAAVLGKGHVAPVERAATVTIPALVMNGGASFPFMYDIAQALSKAMPNAQLRTLEGQRHDVNLEVFAPVLVEFFKS